MADTSLLSQDRLITALPRIWVGFILAGVVLLAEIPAVFPQVEAPGGSIGPPIFQATVLIAWIYWLYCVYRFHDAVGSVPGYRHPITPARAVALHFIPFFNFYWVFRWPSRIAAFVNWRTQTNSMQGWIAGVLVLASVVVVRIDGFVGMLLLFAAGAYISHRIKNAAGAAPVPASAMAPPGYSRTLPLS